MKLSWQHRAACRGLDQGLFYPAAEDAAEGTGVVEAAKAVCEPCQVREPCLEFALSRRDLEGIWGGTTERERRQMLRQRRKSA